MKRGKERKSETQADGRERPRQDETQTELKKSWEEKKKSDRHKRERRRTCIENIREEREMQVE